MKLKKKFFKQKEREEQERDEVSMKGMEEKEKNQRGSSLILWLLLLFTFFVFLDSNSNQVYAGCSNHRMEQGVMYWNDYEHFRRCINCGGEMYNTPHSMLGGRTLTEPTCTTKGTRELYCGDTECGYTSTESIAALGHNFAAATCTKPATCTRCGLTSGTTIAHTSGTTYSKDANQHWLSCTVCGTALTKTNHSFSSTVTKAPTCTETGTNSKTCTTCGYNTTETTPAKGHTNSAYRTSDSQHWMNCTVCSVEIPSSRANHSDGNGDHYCDTCGYLMIIDISTASHTLTLGTTSYTYDGTARQPSVALVVEGKTLVKGTDYTVSYSNNINAGVGMVKVTGVNSYEGTINQSFAINRKQVQLIKNSTSLKYNGATQVPSISVNSGVTGETIKLKITGTGIDAGNYIATITIDSVTGGQARKENYQLIN